VIDFHVKVPKNFKALLKVNFYIYLTLNRMQKMIQGFIGIVLMFVSCTSRDTTVDKSKLFGRDYRLFQTTPAWALAKAVEDGDTDKIKTEISKNKSLLKFREPRFGQPLLTLAVMNENYESVEKLLELGADPNMQDFYNGDSPLMRAADIGISLKGPDPRFLKLLLKYGGDANAEENGQKQTRRFTPLMIACSGRYFDYVKILVKAGAKVNTIDEYGDSPLEEALASESPDIVIYLIQNGADFKRVLYKTIDGKNKYIIDNLRYWRFDLESDAYKKKMRLVDFLKKNGMDYWKTPIPETFLNEYPKEYLGKY
jgi:hypothetical protein